MIEVERADHSSRNSIGFREVREPPVVKPREASVIEPYPKLSGTIFGKRGRGSKCLETLDGRVSVK
jgi:hypothetical protein